MKIGQKLVRVQKLIMTKAEIEAMAKEGKIEVKGETILLKSTNQKMLNTAKPIPPKAPTKNITIESIIDDAKPSTSHRVSIKKTYTKKNQTNNNNNESAKIAVKTNTETEQVKSEPEATKSPDN